MLDIYERVATMVREWFTSHEEGLFTTGTRLLAAACVAVAAWYLKDILNQIGK